MFCICIGKSIETSDSLPGIHRRDLRMPLRQSADPCNNKQNYLPVHVHNIKRLGSKSFIRFSQEVYNPRV